MTTDADRLRVMAALLSEACAGFGPSAWRTMAESAVNDYRDSRGKPAAGWSKARPHWECTHRSKLSGQFDCFKNGLATWENESLNDEGACDMHAQEMGVFEATAQREDQDPGDRGNPWAGVRSEPDVATEARDIRDAGRGR